MYKSICESGLFSASTLKIIACITMAIDHVGAYLLPELMVLRIIGRIAFPIFAYFIAEGCFYTRNKPKRLITIAAIGIACETVYILYTGNLYGNILLTFTLSISLIYCVQKLKSIIQGGNTYKISLGLVVFAAILYVVYKISIWLSVDYGFWGVMVPVLVSVFDKKDERDIRLVMLCTGLFLVGINGIQIWSLLSLPLIALYNGKPGTTKFKYGFYAFYPLHLGLIELIRVLM